MATTIENIEQADFDDTTVMVTVSNEKADEETFYVQTTDGEYRSDLGCWISTDTSNGDIDEDNYDYDFSLIIKEAESLIQRAYTIESTDNNSLYLKVYDEKVEVVRKNHNFINSVTSSYQTEYSIVDTFESKDEAIEYVNGMEE